MDKIGSSGKANPAWDAAVAQLCAPRDGLRTRAGVVSRNSVPGELATVAHTTVEKNRKPFETVRNHSKPFEND